MEQFKKVKVVMLPTENKLQNGLQPYLNLKNNILSIPLSGAEARRLAQNSNYQSQHLYFLTDDRIKKEDWCYDKRDNSIFKMKINLEDGDGCGLIFKIIATTDISLMTTVSVPHIGGQPSRKMLDVIKLPQPSQEFIEKYVECYNRGEIITDVLVEYELQSYSNRFEDRKPIGDSETWGKRLSLKINPKDNTIIIKQEKETLRDIMMKNPDIREEVIEFVYKLLKATGKEIKAEMVEIQTNPHIIFSGVDKWIEENL